MSEAIQTMAKTLRVPNNIRLQPEELQTLVPYKNVRANESSWIGMPNELKIQPSVYRRVLVGAFRNTHAVDHCPKRLGVRLYSLSASFCLNTLPNNSPLPCRPRLQLG